MRHLKEVPNAVISHIEREKEKRHEYGLLSYTEFCRFPTRLARMKVLTGMPTGRGEDFVQTIVPPTSVCLKGDALLDKGHFDRDALSYFVAGTKYAFPLAHVYNGSGSICLGSIFVPNKVSRYSPQQPLETLFLHNDRVLSHGGASLLLGAETASDVAGILAAADVALPEHMLRFLEPGYELLLEDGIWRIASEVYRQKGMKHAVAIMEEICINIGAV